MTDVGELVVRIKADAAQLERELKKANTVVTQSAGGMEKALGSLKSQMLSLVPALSAIALVRFGKDAIETAGHIVDLADRIGFAADTLSALETPLAASGASLDEFTGAVNRMNNILGEAAKGNEEAIRAFDSLGLSVDKLRALSPEEQFYEIATALGQIKDQSTQTEAGMNIFGRSFSTLLPLLKQYQGNMREAVDAQKALNDGISEDSLRRIDEFGDRLTGAGIRARNAFLEVIGTVLRLTDMLAGDGLPANASYDRPQTVNSVTRDPKAINDALRKRGLGSASASGSNAELLAQVKARQEAAKATGEHAVKTRELTDANDELSESMKEAARFQQILHDKLASTLTDIAFRADSAADAMFGFAESIAKAAFEKRVAGPLADSLIGTGGKTGLLDDAIGSVGSLFGGFFADGGSPPVGVPSVVGERGPEIFVPNTSGTIIPNNKIGGSTTAITHVWQIQSGVTRQELASIIPIIESRATAATFAAMQQGGSASKIIGARS